MNVPLLYAHASYRPKVDFYFRVSVCHRFDVPSPLRVHVAFVPDSTEDDEKQTRYT